MRVGDLIEELKKHNPDANVCLSVEYKKDSINAWLGSVRQYESMVVDLIALPYREKPAGSTKRRKK